jgi:hypothetical protein
MWSIDHVTPLITKHDIIDLTVSNKVQLNPVPRLDTVSGHTIA